jgi:N-hydroxyarylamine O-acetyltransferase
MFLTVALPEGRFVLDPGFGALAPRLPVPLVDGGAKARAGEEVHWMARDSDHWILRTRAADKVVDCWVSPLDRDNVIDFEVGNHFTSTHPSSPFVNRIMLRALTANGRVGVMNRDVTVWRGGEPEAARISDRSALRSLLAEHFGFDLPEIEQLRVPSIPEWQ